LTHRSAGLLLLILSLGIFAPTSFALAAGTPAAPATQTSASGTTWYIRADGGTRYTPKRVSYGATAQCDGQHDAPFPAVGTTNVLGQTSNGVNQPCAYNDYRFLYDDQTYANSGWVIAGGDTVLLRDGPWRVGFEGPNSNDPWCSGGNGNGGCTNPTVPAGTAAQHTRILGQNYAACTSHSSETQIFGGHGVYTPMNLNGAQFVDVACIELTSHSQCIVHGSPNPDPCSTGYPVSDFDSDGILTDIYTHDLTLTDMWVHGHTDRGVKGAIGGVVTALRVDIAYNAMAGWDFDDGTNSPTGYGTPSVNGTWNFLYSTIEWSGCNQEYPITHAIPCRAAYGQSNGAYGDGVGSPPGTCFTVHVDHSHFLYNIQDGLDIGHADSGPSGIGYNDHNNCPMSVTNSIAIGNSGSSFKWGPNMSPAILENNVSIINCYRLSKPFPGAPASYNANLGDFCRGGDALSFNFHANGVGTYSHNTLVTYALTSFDIKCWEGSDMCPGSSYTFQDNINYGLQNQVLDYNGNSGGVGDFCWNTGNDCSSSDHIVGTVKADHNLWFGHRNMHCPAGPSGDVCSDPLFVNEPAEDLTLHSGSFTEAAWDGFNPALTSASPAKGAGISIPALLSDYNNFPYASPTAIGAMEYGSVPMGAATPTLQTIAFSSPSPIDLLVGSFVTPACTATWSDLSTKSCLAAGAVLSSDSAQSASVSSSGTLTGIAAGTGHLVATLGSVVGKDPFTVTAAAPVKPTLQSLAFAPAAPIALVVGSSSTPACIATFSDASTSSCIAAGAVFSSDATSSATANAAGTLTAVAAGSGHLIATMGASTGADAFTITAAPPVKPTLQSLAFAPAAPIALVVGSSSTPACIATFSDGSTSSCIAAGAVFSSDAASSATANAAGTLTAVAAGSGHLIATVGTSGAAGFSRLLATVGAPVATNAFTITAPPAKPTLQSLNFATPNSIALLVGKSVTPACTAIYSDNSTSACSAAGATFSSDAPPFATANSTGMLTAVAPGTGHLIASVGSILGTDAFTVTAAPAAHAVAISIAQPQFGFNVIPGATRRIFATVTNGSTNHVSWMLKSGSALISTNSGSWIDVTAPASGTSCQIGKSGQSVSSATQFTIEATAVDDTASKAIVTFNVCKPNVQISAVPSYRTLYANQAADIQSLVVGSVNEDVRWSIATQPTNGNGKIGDSTARDTVFSATIPGRYTLLATSAADPSQTATSTLYVTGHNLPYRLTRNLTEPVDCSVDPALTGKTYEVGPTQAFHRLKDVPLVSIAAGSTIRLHNEDATGLSPTTYHEYLQIARQGSAAQPIRLCGLPDSAGNLPVIDASNATGRSDTTSSVAGNGLVTVGGGASDSVWPAFSGAQNIIIEGLHLRNARAGIAYTSPSGAAATWGSSAACLRIADGHNITLVGNEMDACATGAASLWNGTTWGGSSLNHLWEGNYIHASGTAGSSANHQMYLQAWGQVVQFNRIDGITPGASGANLKSRGIQDVIRYNYFGDGSARAMDLVDVQSGARFMSFGDFFGSNAAPSASTYSMDVLAAWQQAWNAHFAYGNVYRNSTSNAPIHFAYDQNSAEAARKGSLYWYNNTFYQAACSTCGIQLWTMFDTGAGTGTFMPQAEFQTVQAFNNLVWVDSSSRPVFQWNNFEAFIGLGGSNLMPAGWGANTLEGGSGDGWNATANAAAYQNAGSLSLHISGFDGSNVQTLSAMPFDKVSLNLANAAPATSALPTEVCEMPTRFTYLPTLGYAIPRTPQANIGATDTAPQTSAVIDLVGTSRQSNLRSVTCH